MIRFLQFIVLVYQKTLSPIVGNQCRFTPTCSCYMQEALGKHGALKGFLLGVWRILRCNPFYKGAWVDNVPESFAWKDLFRYKTPTQKTDINN